MWQDLVVCRRILCLILTCRSSPNRCQSAASLSVVRVWLHSTSDVRTHENHAVCGLLHEFLLWIRTVQQ